MINFKYAKNKTPAQIADVTGNIRVRSIIGRLLEHSRVFYFDIAGTEHLYLSSADWMNRNMLRRIELAWPVTDPVLRQRIIDECLLAYLHDEALSWQMRADNSYQRTNAPFDTPKNVQKALMDRYRNDAQTLQDTKKKIKNK